MLIKSVFGKQNILNEIENTLNKEAEKKVVVLGNIDDSGYELFEECFERNNPDVFFSINKKSTTKVLLEKINNLENVYIHNNNDNIDMQNSNMIIIKNENGLEAIISTFDFSGNTINNTKSFVLVLKEEINEKSSLYELYSTYDKTNSSYIKLSEEVIKDLKENKQLRNDKAATLTKAIDEDEIVKSFRNIAQVEDKDEYLKMLKIKNNIKKSNLGSSELIYGGEEEINKFDLNSDDDIEIDIEL